MNAPFFHISRRTFLRGIGTTAAATATENFAIAGEADPVFSWFDADDGTEIGFVVGADDVTGKAISEIVAMADPQRASHYGQLVVRSVNVKPLQWKCAAREDCPNAGYHDVIHDPEATAEDVVDAASAAGGEACPGRGHTRGWLNECDGCPAHADNRPDETSRFIEEGVGKRHLVVTFEPEPA
jgi:hypothetical protein